MCGVKEFAFKIAFKVTGTLLNACYPVAIQAVTCWPLHHSLAANGCDVVPFLSDASTAHKTNKHSFNGLFSRTSWIPV